MKELAPDSLEACVICGDENCKRWGAMIRCYEHRNPALTVGNDPFCGKGPYSRLEHYTT